MNELNRVTLPASVTFFPDKCFCYCPDIRTQFFDCLEREEPTDLLLVVPHGSYAEKYAKDYGYTIEYSD